MSDMIDNSDLSIFSLIIHADLIVQIVMLLLLAASIFSWSTIFDKIMTLKKQEKKADVFEHYLQSGKGLRSMYNNITHKKDNLMIEMFLFATKQLEKFNDSNVELIKDKLSNAMQIKHESIIKKFEKNVDWLATIGSTSPFIGLLGTVWGIMHSFQSIALAKNTTLAVVAPSIAEALLATAAGLLVAIPAVIFYNRITIRIQNFSHRLNNFSLNLQSLIIQSTYESQK